jgi:hypothetical protein
MLQFRLRNCPEQASKRDQSGHRRHIGVFEMAARWIGLTGLASIIKAKRGPAVGAHDNVEHREIDVRMVVRRQDTDAVEFVDADRNLADRKLIVEF